MRKSQFTRETKLFSLLRDLFGELTWVQNGFHSFLLTPKGYPKQLDFYIPSLKLAFEHHGQQHTNYVKFFHKSISGFEKMKNRDKEKARQCKEKKITLIVVWHEEVLCHKLLIQKVREQSPSIYAKMKSRWKKRGYND